MMNGFANGRKARLTNDGTRGREARRNDERLYFKFIVKYFEELHPDLFAKATNLHKETKKLNPNVKDLTKTASFMTVVTPNIPVPRYYYNRLLKTDIAQQLQSGPRMVLQIPLQTQQPSPSVTAHTPSQPSQPAPLLMSDPSVTAHTPSQPSQSAPLLMSDPSVTAHTPSQPSQPAPLLLPEKVYNQILSEIQGDPDMAQIFNDFNLANDDDDMNAQPAPQQTPNDDDDMNPFVWDDISKYDIISPLEDETLGW